MGVFADSSQLRALGEGKYRGEVSDVWSVSGNINGGWLMSAAARAAVAELPHGDPLTVSGQYTAPVREGELLFVVSKLNEGRSNSLATVQVLQDDRLACFFTVTATDFIHVKGASFQHLSPPVLPPWQDCVPQPSDSAPSIQQRVAMRYPENMRWWARQPGEAYGYECWSGHADGAALQPLDLLLLCDAVPPAIFSTLGVIGWVPTIALSVMLLAPPTGRRSKVRVQSRSLNQGLGEESVELWSEQGQLMALSRQLLKART